MADEEQQNNSTLRSSSSSQQQQNATTNQLENIKVAVRLRPFTEKEKQRKNRRILDIEQNTVILFSPRYGDSSLKRFTFDYSYWSHDGFKKDSDGVNIPDLEHPNYPKYVGQEEVFKDLGTFLLKNALEGYNSALLAYGQTGSGKSYTVSGYGNNEGILPRFARAIFQELDKKFEVAKDNNNSSGVEQSLTTDETRANLSEKSSKPEESETKDTSYYEVLFSMYEIYNEVVRDLLSKNHEADFVGQTSVISRRGLKIREHPKHGFFVENLTSFSCANKDELERRIEEGQLNKSIAATSMNETSSRGHTIYEFRIKQYKAKTSENSEVLITSMVQLVDLAGSERLAVHVGGQLGGNSFIASRSNSPYPKPKERSRRSKVASSSASSTGSTSINNHYQRFKESVSINQSLSALGNCIQVLSQYSQQLDSANGNNSGGSGGSTNKKTGGSKIPYRDSVLTKLLNKCCLSGNSKVAIIATLSPVDMNYDDTLSTLRFADRAKQIRVHATVNQMFKENSNKRAMERVKRKLSEGNQQLTRSDDSSQTSNFDDTENPVDNFKGPRSLSHGEQLGYGSHLDAIATPSRSRTTIRKSSKHSRVKQQVSAADARLATPNSSSFMKEQLKQLVSPAPKRYTKSNGTHNNEYGSSIRKSRSIGHNLSGAKTSNTKDNFSNVLENEQIEDAQLEDEELGEIELDEMDDIKEGLISPESEDEFIEENVTEGMSDEEKISLINKMLSNSVNGKERSFNYYKRQQQQQQQQQQQPKKKTTYKSPVGAKVSRPKKANRTRAGLKQVSMMSLSLRKSNPFLSNLNIDEQLTGMISYLIKQGETILGKSSDCDIVLRGTELRGCHARITRILSPAQDNKQNSLNQSSSAPKTRDGSRVFIEPILDESSVGEATNSNNVALKVNGFTIKDKIPLYHNDRILFGTNSYFVFNDNDSINPLTSRYTTSVTYDFAQNEVLEKILAEEKNEAMIKEIKDYTHRPGTGKHNSRAKQTEDVAEVVTQQMSTPTASRTRETHNVTNQESSDELNSSLSAKHPPTDLEKDGDSIEINLSNKESANYRDQLMEDTYELALPVAEVNAVAKEMDIKVTYELKILTGEEQLPSQAIPTSAAYSSNSNDGCSLSSSFGADSTGSKQVSPSSAENNDKVTNLTKLDALDIPPAVFVKVHLEEHDIDLYWSKEKFQDRRYKILELYGPWDLGGKSGLVEHLIDQSKTQGDYLIDPFVDNVNSTQILIGHAQISLQPIVHLTDMEQSFDILDMSDETLGSISVQAVPCHDDDAAGKLSDLASKELPYRPYNEEEFETNLISNPQELLGKKLVFLLKIISCHDIPIRYRNVFCQYTLSLDRSSIRTEIRRNSDSSEEMNEQSNSSSELIFDHWHYIRFVQVTQDILDFFEHGFLTIQLVGQHKLSNKVNRSLTIVSTIIDSINKYKYKLEQGSYSGTNYTYFNSNPDSARSNGVPLSGVLNSGSGASSVASTSATLFDQQNEEEEAISSINGLSQENIIDMILTKRKLDRAENQLHYLKRTVNIAEHYNKKHIPIKTVKKLLNSYGHELDNGSIEEMSTEVTSKRKTAENKQSGCNIQ